MERERGNGALTVQLKFSRIVIVGTQARRHGSVEFTASGNYVSLEQLLLEQTVRVFLATFPNTRRIRHSFASVSVCVYDCWSVCLCVLPFSPAHSLFSSETYIISVLIFSNFYLYFVF